MQQLLQTNTMTKLVTVPLALALVASATALACNGRQATATPSAVITQVGATSWNIVVPGWATIAIASGAHCGVGLSVPAAGDITSVNSLAMFREANSGSLPIVFVKKTKVATEWQAKQAGNWTGFLGTTSAAIAAGVKNLYTFNVTTKAGVDAAKVVTALKASWIGSDAADATGGLAGTSQVLFQFTTATEETREENLRLFHNVGLANVSTRATANAADTIYFMQPRAFRYGYGGATGWRVLLQDQDAATGQTVRLGYVKYQGTTDKPDLSAAGALTTVSFSVFGTGSGTTAVRYTMTTATKVPLDPYIGITIALPAPQSWPQDGITMHAQEGSTTKLNAPNRKQWTFRKNGSAAAPLLGVGSTFHLGGLYDVPTQQVAVVSNAYGPPTRRLFGPESLSPDWTGRTEFTAFLLRSDSHKTGTVSLVLITPKYSPVPIPVSFGSILVLAPILTNAVVPMDANGQGVSIGFPIGPGSSLAMQTMFLRFSPFEATLSDASLVTAH